MRLGGTKATAIHQYRGLGNQLYDLAGSRPSLDLRFADNKSLVDSVSGQNLITFTRASTGTYVDSDGVIRSAATNLLLRSEEFDQSPWTAAAFSGGTIPTVTVNAAVAPNGTTTADRVVFPAETGSAQNALQQTIALTTGIPHTFSFWARAVSGTVSNLLIRIGATEQALGQAITTEWKRYAVTLNPVSAGDNVAFKNRPSTTGSGAAMDLYLWGAQLEIGSTATAYIPTGATINSAPRFDHNPLTGECLGLLVEEQRQNLLLRSEEFDVSPWGANNTVLSPNSIVAPDGTSTADKLVENTAAGVQHRLDQAVSTTANQTYCFSVYVKAGETSTFVVQVVAIGSSAATSNAGFTVNSGIIAWDNGLFGIVSSVTAQSVGNGWYRCIVIYTLNGTVTTHQIRIYPRNTSTYTGDGASGIYLWGAQLEAGAFPTSYIKTEAAAATRTADVASISGTNFSSWYRQDEGTVFAEFTPNSIAGAIGFDDGTNSERWRIGHTGGSAANLVVTDDNSLQVNIFTPLGSAQLGSRLRLAGAVKSNDFALYIGNTGDLATSTSGSMPTVSQATIGFARLSGEVNGAIRRLAYFPQRLSNNVLQSITL